jgi:CRISPR-associated protein Csx16
MTTLFISRHPGALEWAAAEGLAVDARLAHLDPETIQPGDVVIGTLPIHLAARVCERGGRYLHLSLELPPEQRGRELSAADLRQCGARLEEYRVTRLVVSG